MKKFIMVVIALLYSFIGVNMVFADTWTQKADFGGVVRQATFSFSIGNKGYIGAGGVNFPNINYNDFWEYDPTTDTWTQKADFGGTARGGAVGFSIGNKGYAGTGNATSTGAWVFAKDFWEYDPATNTWTQKADFGGVGRFGAIGFSINNKGYIGTGKIDSDAQTKDFWEYDPTTDTWTQKADFGGIARAAAVGFSIGNKGYVGTGGNGNETEKDFWEYDPETDTWTQKADFVVEAYCTGLSIGNKGYIGLVYPYYGGTYTNYFAEYDPATDTWTQKADFGGISRSGAASFSIGNKGYIGTGVTMALSSDEFVSRKDFWEYDPNGGNDIILVPVANKTSLWPPNNKMIPITIWSNVSSSLPVTLTVQISCNEPPKRDNDWTEPVIDQATGVISLSLRATRAGSGTGRIYTITITATDSNGNSATETIDIVVPHDQGNN